MSEPERVPRLLDAESGASSAVRFVLASAEDHEPSAEALTSLRSRLASRLPLGALPAPPPVAGVGAKGTLGALVKGAASLVVVAALGAGGYGLLRGATPVKVEAPSVPSSESVVGSTPDLSPALEATAESAPPAPPAGSATSRLPPPSIATPAPRAAAPSTVIRESEATLLSRAHEALLHGDAAAALATTDEHARLYPKGSLAQERERIAIEALVMTGDMRRARSRADALYEKYPDSPHRARLDALVRP